MNKLKDFKDEVKELISKEAEEDPRRRIGKVEAIEFTNIFGIDVKGYILRQFTLI